MNCIICLKIGDLYSSKYVNNLYRAVRRYSDDDFLCFTDDPTGIDPGVICCIMLPRSSEGWWPTWSKIEIFGREELKSYDKKIYFDLDLVIQGDIQCILNHDAEWAAIHATWKGVPFKMRNPGESLINTSVMVWKDNTSIYDRWESDWRNIVKNYRGTDYWYHKNKMVPSTLPKVFYSYREGSKPIHYWDNDFQPYLKYQSEYSVCLFHQKPEIHDLDNDSILYRIWDETIS